MSKVIKILDPYNILINREGLDGISNKSILEIFEEGPTISYEDKNYGTLDVIKAELRIKYIYPEMILCENNKFTRDKIFTQTSLFASPLTPKESYKEIEKVVPLSISSDDTDTDIDLFELNLIRLGDSVRIKQ